jgi:dsDNA-specific endonuclease/ATPase MutS2
MTDFAAGDIVQTPLGKGVVREVRRGGRIVVEVRARSVIFAAGEIGAAEPAPARGRRVPRGRSPDQAAAGPAPPDDRVGEVDLHGLTVPEALARVEDALNAALLADVGQLRFIHGRTGGRVKAALHARLREIPSVRGFALDPRNAGVTVVRL